MSNLPNKHLFPTKEDHFSPTPEQLRVIEQKLKGIGPTLVPKEKPTCLI
jgi:hypothetical protein